MISMEIKGPGQYLLTAQNTVEIEGQQKPALVAETLVMLYERRTEEPAGRCLPQLRRAGEAPRVRGLLHSTGTEAL